MLLVLIRILDVMGTHSYWQQKTQDCAEDRHDRRRYQMADHANDITICGSLVVGLCGSLKLPVIAVLHLTHCREKKGGYLITAGAHAACITVQNWQSQCCFMHVLVCSFML